MKVTKWLMLLCLCFAFSAQAVAVEIEYWHPQQPPSAKITDKEMAGRFMVAHPEVKIKLQGIPVENMSDKMTLAVVSNRLPDVVRDYLGRVGDWANKGLLEDLNGTLSQEDLDDYYESLLDTFTINGELIGYPHRLWVQTYDVNKTILDKVGVALPEGEWDMTEWEGIAEKVATIPDVFPTVLFAGGRGGDYWILQVFEIFGAHLYEKKDYTRTTLNCAGGLKTLEWMMDVLDKGWAPKGAAGMQGKECLGLWNSGKIAMGCAGTRIALPSYNQELFDSGIVDELQDIRVVTQPHAEGVPAPGLFAGPSGVVVFKQDDAEVKTAAVAFAQFLSSRELCEYWNATYFELPVRRSLNPFAGIEAYEKAMALIEKYGLEDMGITSQHYLEGRDLFSLLRQEVYSKVKKPAEALKDFEEAIANLWK